eukprot:1187473-Prorocentrum_minimum.AAC.1
MSHPRVARASLRRYERVTPAAGTAHLWQPARRLRGLARSVTKESQPRARASPRRYIRVTHLEKLVRLGRLARGGRSPHHPHLLLPTV